MDAHTDLERIARKNELRVEFYNRLGKYFLEKSPEHYSSLKEAVDVMISEGILKRDIV